MVRTLATAVVLLLAAGCFFPADRGKLLEAKVDSLEQQRAQLEAALKETREKLEKTTGQLQEALAQLDTASRTTGANIGVKVDSAIQDAASLRGQLESTQYRLQELEQKLEKLSTAAAPAEARKDELKRPDDPKEYLALAAEKAKTDGALGKRLYDELLKKWPKAPEAGEAHFGLGELHYADDKCREAIYEYGKVIQEFAKAKSTPDAYLRSSDCFLKLKMYDEAKLTLDELARQFPRSDAAKQVKVKLAEVVKAKAAKGPKK